MTKLLASLAAFTALTAAASAADLPRRAAPPPVFTPVPVFTWTGAYFGINAGYAFDASSRTNNTFAVPFPYAAPGTVASFRDRSQDGFSGGAQIGYNWQITPGSGVVIGFEADAQYLDFGRNRNNAFISGAVAPGYYVTDPRGLSSLDYFGTVQGEEMPLEPTLNKLQDPDGAVRKEAAGAISAVLRGQLRVFTLITNTLAKDKEIGDRWRGFKDVADARHLSNRVEPEVVEALVDAVRAAYPRLSHRYYTLKAKWFGQEALPYWDRNAPLPRVEQRTIPWTEARDTVLSAYDAFSPKMAGIARRFFDERWIDAPTRPGKAPGAFAHPTVPSVHPYVLVNYQGKPRDVMTLAHELGHGVHQVLAGPNGALMAPTPLTLAETASVFGEMLTFRRLLAATTDTTQRRAMLAAKVEDMINTVVRQIAFYSFERKVHLARAKGELTTDQINALWLSVQAESLGPAITLDSGYEPFWAYIPHFIHSPFYVYAYAFGDCLVNSLYGVYARAEEGFVDRYFALLSAGGSKPYGELLAPFGLDAKDPGFWQIGLGMIESMIVELESMEGRA
ncbi:M3 family oligoendopeptidase [Methylobacterium organophilum]|nr:M3 family oligoendopeptidase [Methylobacterium organophilum]